MNRRRWLVTGGIAAAGLGVPLMYRLSRQRESQSAIGPSVRRLPRAVNVNHDLAFNARIVERAKLILAQFRTIPLETWSNLLHGARVMGWGDDSGGPWSRARALGLLLNSDLASIEFGYPPYYPSRHGLQVVLKSDANSRSRNGEAHVDETLAVMAEIRLASDREVVVRQRTFTVARIVEAAMANCVPESSEIEWTTMALALYLESAGAWRNKLGQTVSLAMMGQKLIAGAITRGACFGLHRLFTACVLLQVDQETGFLDRGVRSAGQDFVRKCLDRAHAGQLADGSWNSNWNEPGGVHDSLRDRVFVAGHMLEWMAIAPPQLQVAGDSVAGAVEFLIASALQTSSMEWRGDYNNWLHAAGAIQSWVIGGASGKGAGSSGANDK
jgi:hypothetical protein